MSRQTIGNYWSTVCYAAFVAALFLFAKGYTFNTDDQAEHLPQVYQMLDPSLYQHDYFVPAANSIFTVRYYYDLFVLQMAKTGHLEAGMFLMTFLCIALMAYSFIRIADRWFNNRWATLLASLLSMILLYGFTVGGNHIMYGSLISSTLAKAIGAFALWQFLRQRNMVAGLLLGCGTLFQPLVGLQLLILLVGYELVKNRNWKSLLSLVLSYSVVAAFILIPVFQRQFLVDASSDSALYYQVLYRFRNHLHYLPSLFPATDYLKFGLLTAIGLASYFIVRPADRHFYPLLVALSIFGMVVYEVLLEMLGMNAIGKLQWFKVSIWTEAFSAMMLAGLLGRLLSALTTIYRVKRLMVPVAVTLTITLLVLMTNSALLPSRFQHRYLVGNRILTDLEKMHLWIADSTAKDVSVLVPPDDNGFACQAKRSMPIHYQAIVHEPFFMLPWYADFVKIYGVSIENRTELDVRKQALRLYQTRNYRGMSKRIDYRLDNASTCQFVAQLGPKIHQQGDWLLTKFLPKREN